jgi:hypothetical protein
MTNPNDTTPQADVTPYVQKQKGDLIRAEDWNKLQEEARKEIRNHTHTGSADGTQIPTDGIAGNAVNEGKLDSNAVTTDKIDDNAVTEAKLDSNAVDTRQLNDLAVTTGKIGDKQVTTAKIDDNAVDTRQLNDLAVTTRKIGDKQVTTAKINDNAVDTLQLNDLAVTTSKIGDKQVTAAKINDDAVDTNNIIDHSVTRDKLHTDVVTELTSLTIPDDLKLNTLNVTGNVGIGITNPRHPLHISTNSTDWQARLQNGSTNVYLSNGKGYGMYIRTGNDNTPDRYGLWVGNTKRTHFAVRDDGNVGIGTTAPAAKLQVAGPSYLGQGTGYHNHFPWTDNNAYITGKSIFLRGGEPEDWRQCIRVDTKNSGVLIGTPSYEARLELVGRAHSTGGWEGGGRDYAEYLESENGSALPAGTSVIFTQDGKVRPAHKGEVPFGIITSNPVVVGNYYSEWPQKYLKDEFGTPLMEEYEEEIMEPKKEIITRERQKTEQKTISEKETRTDVVLENGKYCQKEITEMVTREVEEEVFEEVDLYDDAGKEVIGKHRVPVMETYEEENEVLDENGTPVMVGTGNFEKKQRPKLNPDYDESKEYVTRKDRPEWNCVGLLGQLLLRKGQPVAPTWIKIGDKSEKVELWLVK